MWNHVRWLSKRGLVWWRRDVTPPADESDTTSSRHDPYEWSAATWVGTTHLPW